MLAGARSPLSGPSPSAQRGSTPGLPSIWDASGGRACRPHPLTSREPARRARPSAVRTAASTRDGTLKVSQQERESWDRGRERGRAGRAPFPIEISPELTADCHPGAGDSSETTVLPWPSFPREALKSGQAAYVATPTPPFPRGRN